MTKKYYWLLVLLVAIYVITILVFQPDSAVLTRYHIGADQLKILSLTIVIPTVIIWFAAFYSIANASKYAGKIVGSADGEGFKFLTWGLIVLGLNLPIVSITSRFLTYSAQQNITTHAFSTIINTHLSVLFYIIAFALLCKGSTTLLKTVKKVKISKTHIYMIAMAIVIIGAPYTIATFLNPSREVAMAPSTTATYYMPDWLIATTIVFPYIVAWACGFYTTLTLHTYYQKVGGKIYRTSLSKLNRGFFVVITSSILVQFITAASTSLSGWGLGALLLLVYVLLAFIALGYVLIALGAKGLAKLEEVT